jgi:hypothetical protein
MDEWWSATRSLFDDSLQAMLDKKFEEGKKAMFNAVMEYFENQLETQKDFDLREFKERFQ